MFTPTRFLCLFFRSRRIAVALLFCGVGLILTPGAQFPEAAGGALGASAGRSKPGWSKAGTSIRAPRDGEAYQRDLYWAIRRGLHLGVPRDAYQAAAAQMQTAWLAAAGAAPVFSWDFLGPLPMLGDLPNFGGQITGPPLSNATGRVAALAVDPKTPGRLFVGTAGGGVWMTNNGGASFAPIFDAQPTLAIGALAVIPTATGVAIYVGTGEGNGSDSYYGQGIFRSNDLGKTWVQLGAAFFRRLAFTKLAVDTNNPPHIFAAVTAAASLGRADPEFMQGSAANEGLWRSTDAGGTWKHYPSTAFGGARCGTPCPADDVVIDPGNPKKVYAAIDSDDVYRSTDGGQSWKGAAFPGVAVGAMGRQSLAIAPSSPATVYAMLGAAAGAANVGQYRGFFQSNDSGVHWAARTVPTVTLGAGANATILDGTGTTMQTDSQSSYDQALAVKRDNAAVLFFGGIGTYVSSNAGASWAFTGGAIGGGAQVTHADQHAAVVDPFNTNVVYFGNDGGVYSYDLGSRTWRALNFAISAGQIQAIGPHPSNNNTTVSGFQDNGTQLYNGSQGWKVVETGDGGFALFDQANPSLVYHTFASAGSPATPQIATSTDSGMTWNFGGPTGKIDALIKSGGGPVNFYPPLAIDPSTPRRVMLGGHSVFVSTDGMFTWRRQTTQNLTGTGCTSGDCALQDIEISPADRNRAWSLSIQNTATPNNIPFALYNTRQGNLNTGAAWTNVTANLTASIAGFNAGATQATGIALNRHNRDDAYLSLSGFTASTRIGHVFRTTDFGNTWVRRDGTGGQAPLPDVPVLRVVVDSADITGNTILAATDTGVFRSLDGGQTWTPFNLGIIPALSVFDIEQNYNDVIFVGTHGRGSYRLSITPEFTPGTFQPTGNMSTPRFFHTVTALPGAKVLVVGGVIDNFHALSSAELYNPATHSFTVTGSLLATPDDKTATRSFHSATLLLDGRVLIAGGQDKNFTPLLSAEIYSPGTGSFSNTGNLVAPRVDGSAALLCDGRVLISGGSDKNGMITNSAEVYDPKTGTFSATGSMNVTRDAQTSTLLRDCTVLIAGGANGVVLDSAELYDPITGTFSLLSHTMVSTRVNHAASLLADGRVLITGGKDESNTVLMSAELYNPLTGIFTRTGDMTSQRLSHSSAAIDTGQVLIAAGSPDGFESTKLASAELYNPLSGKFALTGSLKVGRVEQVAVKLTNQQILVVGGIDQSSFSEKSAELYQPPPPPPARAVPSPTPTVKPTPARTPTPTRTRTPTRTPTRAPTPKAA